MSEKFKVGDVVRWLEQSCIKDSQWQESKITDICDYGWMVSDKKSGTGVFPFAWEDALELLKSEPPFKVDDRITWGTQHVSGVVSRIEGEVVFFYPELWQWIENGSHWQPSLDVISLSDIMDSGFKIVQPKKEEKMQEIEVGSTWRQTSGNIDFEATVVHVSSGQAASVFYEFNDGSGGNDYVSTFLEEWKPLPQTLTRWTYVYRDEEGAIGIDLENFETEQEAIDDCASMRHNATLIKTIKIEYTPE